MDTRKGKMMKAKNTLISSLIFAGFAITLYCSQSPQNAGVVDDTETGIQAMLFNPDGTKAVGATVKFFTPLDTSKIEKYSVVTDTNGRYAVSNMTTGSYNIWAEKESLVTFQGNVSISGDTNFIRQDTLKAPASITGIVGVEPNHNPENVTVQILGTEIYSMVDVNGRFTLKKLPEGDFTLRFTITDPGYVATLFDWRTTRGKADTLADTILLKYNGIPVVRGLKAQFDTANGVVRLSWNKVKYNDLQDYWIYRDFYDSIVFSTKPVAARADTFFVDSIYKKGLATGPFSSMDSTSYTFKYRVAVTNNSLRTGETYKYATVKTVPYQSVIPGVDTIKVAFDTLDGIVNLSWNGVATFSGFGGYRLVRTITGSDTTDVDTLGIVQALRYADSLFKNTLSFSDSGSYVVSYSICVYRSDWNLYGKTTATNTVSIAPYYTKVPIVNNIQIGYDTLQGTLRVSWDSLSDLSQVHGFVVTRRIVNVDGNIDRVDTFTVRNAFAFIDSIYPKYVSFYNIGQTSVTYAIVVKHKAWGISGVARSQSIAIYSYKKFTPVVYAGPDQNVDFSSEVLLEGRVISSAWSVKKLEWKIGDSTWVDTDSGKAMFMSDTGYNTETIICILRVTDSVGNVGLDTVNVVKQQLVVAFGKFPSQSVLIQGTSTLGWCSDFSDNKAWFLGVIDNDKFAAWSTTDFVTWKTENSLTGIQERGELIICNGIYYYFEQYRSKSYKSPDGISWSEITPDLPKNEVSTNFCVLENKMYALGKYPSSDQADTLYSSIDGITWTRHVLPIKDLLGSLVSFRGKLYATGWPWYSATKKWCSLDNGLTWTEDKLWDLDYSSFPDDVHQMIGNDSVIVAFYQERPAGIEKISIFRNGIWKTVSIANFGMDQDWYHNKMFLFRNRLMWASDVNGSVSIKSIKLY